jgi:trans-2,3-dihydro-3-hydroxyanthranilate isomerase
MGRLTFYIVDVFAEEKYAGNQLAVFRGGNALTDVDMQRIAKEMNFSETTFILSETQREGGFDVRIFTPRREVPFAGHPTLGTAHIIRKEIVQESAGKIVLNLKVGQIPVTFSGVVEQETTYWMKQIEPIFGETLSAEVIAPVLSLSTSEIDDRFPIEEVSTGLPHILVPLRSLESLKRAQVAQDRYFEFIENRWAKPILIFCPEPHNSQNDISVRMFADIFGIREDPATGSGNGCLAGYLVRHRYWGREKIDIRCEQGYEIGRPSLLFLRAEKKGGQISISVGGKAVTIAKGEFV